MTLSLSHPPLIDGRRNVFRRALQLPRSPRLTRDSSPISLFVFWSYLDLLFHVRKLVDKERLELLQVYQTLDIVVEVVIQITVEQFGERLLLEEL